MEYIVLILILVLGIKFLKKSDKNVKGQWVVTEIKTSDFKILGIIMTTQAKIDQKFTATWSNALDKEGNQTTLTGTSTFSVDNAEVASIVVNPDGTANSAEITTGKHPGTAIVTITNGSITGTLTIDVVAGDAVSIGDPVVSTPTNI